MTEQLRIQLLGGVELSVAGRPLATLRSQKSIALLIYLACTGRTHRREALADLLWEATSTAQSLSNLRTVLARLRRHLGAYMLITPESIALAPDAPIWLDVRALEQKLAAIPRSFSPETAAQMEQTMALYHGDFLAGFHLEGALGFDDWALVERERLRFSMVEALQQLGQHCVHTGNQVVGLRVTARLLALEPLSETAHTQRLRLLAAAGQRAAALAHYAICRQTFLTELGMEPDAEIQALYTQIRDGTLAPMVDPGARANIPVSARHNLPESPAALIGRVRTLRTIQMRLRDPAVRLVTLVGEGGVGKSRLALAAGRQLIGAWPDGVWFAPLVDIPPDPTPTLPNRLATAIAAVIQLPFLTNHKSADPVTQLFDYLRHKELLLILDNFEHRAAGAAFVSDLLRVAQHCRVLITSREPLHSAAESVLPIRGLAAPPATAQTATAVAEFASVQLFVERARRTQPAFALTDDNAGAVAQLCRLAAGSPLALELAAPWVEHFGVVETVDILKRGGFKFLASAAPEALDRHRSLHTVFITSWNLLTPSAQRTLARLSVFQGSCQRQALLAVTGATLADLQVLVSQSLLWRKGRDRYELHDLLRQFAATQLAALEQSAGGEQPSSAERHSLYYLTLAGDAVRDAPYTGTTLAALQEEIDNIRHAWRWAILHCHSEGLEAGWNGLLAFFLHKVLFAEGEEAFRSAVMMLQALPTRTLTQQRLLATLQLAEASFLNLLTRYDEASGLAQSAIDSGAAAADNAIKARGYLQLGTALYRRGRYELALDKFQAALAAADSAHLPAVAGDILRLTGITLLETSEFGAARSRLEAALAIYRQVGNRLGEGNALNDLGWLGQREQNLVDALAYLQAARRVHQAIDNRHGISMVLINMGIVYELRGEYGRAYACYQEVQGLLEELDDPYQRSLLNHSLGFLLARVGDYPAALACYLRSLEIDHEIGDRAGMAWTQNGLGLLHNHLGDAKTALAYHKEALRSSSELGARTVQGIAYLGIGQDLYELGSLNAACQAFQAAIAIQDDLGQTLRAMEAKSGLARTLLALHQNGAAQTLADEVLAYLATNTLQGARQPFLVYLDCYRVLVANSDPRAPRLLREAYLHLQQQADKIENDAWRASFLQQIQANQSLVAAYRALCLAPAVEQKARFQPLRPAQ